MKDNITSEPVSSEPSDHGMAIGVNYETRETHSTPQIEQASQCEIVVPLDGSELAERALAHAIVMARASSGAITLLRIVPPLTLIEPIGGGLPPTAPLWEAWEAEPQVARDYLHSVAAKLRNTDLVVQTRVLEGDPADEIVAYAEKDTAVSLVVMSTHGRSGLNRWFMGGVAEKVLHSSPVPLLVFRPQDDEPREAEFSRPQYKTILVPLDGSELAEQALGEAQTLAQEMDAKIVLVSVSSTPFDLVMARKRGTGEWSPIPWDEKSQRLWDKVDAVSRRLEGEQLEVEARLTYGDPADEILKTCGELGADIIVMATHGRGGLGRLLIGSVAARLVHAARVPVLLVRVKAGAAVSARMQQMQSNVVPEPATPV